GDADPLILRFEVNGGGHAPAHGRMDLGEQHGYFVDNVPLVLRERLPDQYDLAGELDVREGIQGDQDHLPFLKFDHVDLCQVGGLHDPPGEIRNCDCRFACPDRTACADVHVCDHAIEGCPHREGC